MRAGAGALVAAVTIVVVAGGPSTSEPGLAAATATASPACTHRVRTSQGPLCGLNVKGAMEYLGIPYAAAPTGKLRWQPPQAPAKFRSPFQATRLRPDCAGTGTTGSEDCLWVNVYVPRGGATKLPVMVWIHGGGFVTDDDSGNGIGTGTGSGQDLADREHVIVVRVSYRLGVFGFLAGSELGKDSGNYGLLDQHAALKWVQQNIGAFGGDSKNVTVFGQSAGASSICMQLISPDSRGLFQRAIIQSGQYPSFFGKASCAQTLPTEGQAESSFETLAESVGCFKPSKVVSCLRAVPTAELVQDSGDLSLTPVINPENLPLQPQTAFASGRFDHVPIIEGVTQHEDGSAGTASAVQVREQIQSFYSHDAARVMQQYPLKQFPTPLLALQAAVSDQMACQSLTTSNELSRWVRVHTYEYDDPNVLFYGATEAQRDVHVGAYHSSDLPALFPGWDDGLANGPVELMVGAGQPALRRQEMDFWGAFARRGTPEPAKAPAWPAYHAGKSAMVMSLRPADKSQAVAASQLSASHHCGVWSHVSEN